MAKKSFGSGFDSLLSGETATHTEKMPKTNPLVKKRATAKESTVSPILEKEESCEGLGAEFSREIKTSVILLEALFLNKRFEF